jgi:hypothetical protein
MKHLKRAWQYIFGEPCTWLFYCFFQPTRFKRECESKDFLKRMTSMLRLAFPMFLFSYPLALCVQIIGGVERNLPVPIVVNPVFRPGSVTGPGLVYFLLAIALISIVSITFGILWGIAGGIAGGIAWGLVLSIAGGIGSVSNGTGPLSVSSFVTSLVNSVFVGIEITFITGLLGGFIGGISRLFAKGRDIRKNIIEGIIGGIVGGILGLTLAGILQLIASTSSVRDIGQASIILRHLSDTAILAGTIAGSITGYTTKNRGRARVIVGGIAGAIVGAIGGLWGDLLFKTPRVSSIWEWGIIVVGSVVVGIVVSIIAGLVLDNFGVYDREKSNIAGLMVLLVGIILLISILSFYSSTMGIVMAIVLGIILGTVKPPATSILLAIVLAVGRIVNLYPLTPEGIKQGLLVDLVLIACFILGYYRVPLYPVSSLSSFRAYLSSRKNPPWVFSYLHRCSLYWDEHALWLLPGLKRTLLIATGQNVEQTLGEISFIVAERPQQIAAARTASLEIAIRDLELHENLREIAQAAQRLTDILPQEAGLVDPHWVTPFARLSDASRDAARACSPLGWQARRSALQEMIADLKKVYPNTAFTDAHLNMRLDKVVKTWRAVAERELEEMERAPEKTSRVENPYNPGPALELRNSLFVGRRDLAQQLGDALGRGSRRPTFLLQGERRMGKSSTLKQLPDLLGARYLPIFYDLQTRGFSSSIAVFLGKIADEIYKVMRTSGLPTKKLAYERLQDASRKNDAEVYHLFERWLEEIEGTLEQEERTLLLTFDEFEKLEEAGRDGYLNLRLLLDWFRSVIQNHQRLALLFSGVRSFGDMDVNWAGYFVNVQTLKISFLQPAEAHQLITRPVPNFPSEQIFGERVVEGIMRVTSCHPFLVQAVCSALLDSLNADKRDRIELPDVGVAANQVLKNWGSTYFRDLWERTDADQRVCILTLNRVGEGDLLGIEQQSGLDGTRVHRALEILLERDIVVGENGIYQIAVPLFGVWVQRSNYR